MGDGPPPGSESLPFVEAHAASPDLRTLRITVRAGRSGNPCAHGMGSQAVAPGAAHSAAATCRAVVGNAGLTLE